MNNFDGVLLLDKPSGITSNKALQIIKKLYNINKKTKVGHTGSLDPLATGMLPICFGEATKFSRFLLNSDKKYLVTMQLGFETDTGDIDGAIIATCQRTSKINFIPDQINQALTKFIGEIHQIPPIYSAIKYKGTPLYKLARSKNFKDDFILLPRLIKIYSIKLLKICNIEKKINLEVHCSKGTYIRSLITDLAKNLNCLGTVSSLRRIVVGNLAAEDLISMGKLEDAISSQQLAKLLLPVATCLFALPKLTINRLDAIALHQGKKINLEKYQDHIVTLTKGSLICLFNDTDNKLLGVGELIDSKILIAKRLVKI